MPRPGPPKKLVAWRPDPKLMAAVDRYKKDRNLPTRSAAIDEVMAAGLKYLGIQVGRDDSTGADYSR